ncbi:MAG: sigma-54-dependent Fis family transcriptional regulator [Acidobacteria bacterium]|nr:sigma-54-dependent Fis family transcriptional regulator [Acidobacteriota bacterium]
MKAPTVLIVEDDTNFRRVLEFQLNEAGYKTTVAENGEKALKLFAEHSHRIVLTDLNMPGLSGEEVLKQVKQTSPDTPVVIITAFGSIDSAVEAMKLGAFHYLTKPVNNDELIHTINNAFKYSELIHENRALREAVSSAFRFDGIIGSSNAMRKVLDRAERLAHVDTTVLITGESGTGKEILAKAIHFNSPRNGKPFMVINCGAIPETLLESELFGYRKGAFSGADRNKTGKFEAADGGTVLLDEIGELPLPLQVKVLRVVQENEIDTVGENTPRKVDVRIVAASNRDLKKLAAAGEFRQDLYYRLNVAPLVLPPLRERKEDIPLLARFFVERISKKHNRPSLTLGGEILRKLESYDWPGNVRELENCIERLAIFAQTDAANIKDLPEEIRTPRLTVGKAVFQIPPEGVSMPELEKMLVVTALERNQWNQTQAANFLGISRNVLIYRMQKYRLGPYENLPADEEGPDAANKSGTSVKIENPS